MGYATYFTKSLHASLHSVASAICYSAVKLKFRCLQTVQPLKKGLFDELNTVRERKYNI